MQNSIDKAVCCDDDKTVVPDQVSEKIYVKPKMCQPSFWSVDGRCMIYSWWSIYDGTQTVVPASKALLYRG